MSFVETDPSACAAATVERQYTGVVDTVVTVGIPVMVPTPTSSPASTNRYALTYKLWLFLGYAGLLVALLLALVRVTLSLPTLTLLLPTATFFLLWWRRYRSLVSPNEVLLQFATGFVPGFFVVLLSQAAMSLVLLLVTYITNLVTMSLDTTLRVSLFMLWLLVPFLVIPEEMMKYRVALCVRKRAAIPEGMFLDSRVYTVSTLVAVLGCATMQAAFLFLLHEPNSWSRLPMPFLLVLLVLFYIPQHLLTAYLIALRIAHKFELNLVDKGACSILWLPITLRGFFYLVVLLCECCWIGILVMSVVVMFVFTVSIVTLVGVIRALELATPSSLNLFSYGRVVENDSGSSTAVVTGTVVMMAE